MACLTPGSSKPLLRLLWCFCPEIGHCHSCSCLLGHLLSTDSRAQLLTRSLARSLSHSLSRSISRSLTHSLPHSRPPHSLALSLTHSPTHPILTHSLAHPLTLSSTPLLQPTQLTWHSLAHCSLSFSLTPSVQSTLPLSLIHTHSSLMHTLSHHLLCLHSDS